MARRYRKKRRFRRKIRRSRKYGRRRISKRIFRKRRIRRMVNSIAELKQFGVLDQSIIANHSPPGPPADCSHPIS